MAIRAETRREGTEVTSPVSLPTAPTEKLVTAPLTELMNARAAALGCTEKAVDNALQRIRRKLRKYRRDKNN